DRSGRHGPRSRPGRAPAPRWLGCRHQAALYGARMHVLLLLRAADSRSAGGVLVNRGAHRRIRRGGRLDPRGYGRGSKATSAGTTQAGLDRPGGAPRGRKASVDIVAGMMGYTTVEGSKK